MALGPDGSWILRGNSSCCPSPQAGISTCLDFLLPTLLHSHCQSPMYQPVRTPTFTVGLLSPQEPWVHCPPCRMAHVSTDHCTHTLWAYCCVSGTSCVCVVFFSLPPPSSPILKPMKEMTDETVLTVTKQTHMETVTRENTRWSPPHHQFLNLDLPRAT